MRRGPQGVSELTQLFRYFVEVTSEPTSAELHAKLHTTVPGYEEITMTLAEQWRKEGRVEGGAGMLRRLLLLKLSALSPELDARLAAASLEQLERYAERVLTATTIDAVFQD